MAMFHLFSQLPAELRLTVWHFCLPRRVVELDYQDDLLPFGTKGPCAGPIALADANTHASVLSRVNREARSVALENWLPLPEPDYGSPDLADWAGMISPTPHVVKDCTQYVHLNWAPAQEGGALCRASGDPLRYAMAIADLMPECEMSIQASLLEDVQYRPHSSSNPWTPEELRVLMRRRKSFTVVVLDPIFIHGDTRTVAQTGLFGLLGDAPVQMVRADEKARIHAFVELRREDGMELSFDPSKGQLEQALQDLDQTIKTVFNPDDDDDGRFPRFVPAVMFRYCAHACTLK